MTTLTPREAATLAAIRAHLATTGTVPTLRELAGAIGGSLTLARQRVTALQQKRYLTRAPKGAHRGYTIRPTTNTSEGTK